MILLAAVVYFAAGAVLALNYRASCRHWYGPPEMLAALGILLFWPVPVIAALFTRSR
jgi:hypothetical protein